MALQNAIITTLMALAAARVALAASVNYCYPPIGVEFGKYSPVKTSYSIGGYIEYSCNQGYEIDGQSRAECIYNNKRDQAEFSHPPPVCKRTVIECPDLADPKFGSVSVRGYTPDSSAHYECQDGYKIEGNGYRTCQYDGTWTGSQPKCIPSECPYLSNPTNGEVVVLDNTPGSEARYTCYEGYKLVGHAYRRCLDDCTWSFEEPTCMLIRCPLLPAPSYGRVDTKGQSPGKTAHYSCIPGYKLVGEPYRTCHYDGLWDGKEPKCIPSKCPEIYAPDYGSIEIPAYTPGSRAHYACAKGYKLVGEPYRTCQDDCEWSGVPPTCIPIKCPTHEAPEYGTATFTGYSPNSMVHYTCNAGYKLIGLKYRTCGYDGVWNGEKPTCIPSKCPDLVDLEYGVVTVPDYTPGGRAHYVCNKGYKLVGDAYRTCQDDCEWSGEPPKCVRIECPRHDPPQYASIIFTGYYPGMTVHYKCNSGYKLVGLQYRKCGYDGVWSGDLPKCIEKRCPELGDLQYGSINIPDYYPGSQAHYTCAKGYKLVGEPYRTCQDNCKWSGEPPKCVQIECPRHNGPQYGRVEFAGYIPGLKANYYCNSGYKLVGVNYRICGYDGVWSGELPICRPSRCPNLPDLEYGSVNIPDYAPGSQAHYTCKHGYKLVGEAYRTCQDDCEWSGVPPKCIRIECPKHDAPKHGVVLYNGYTPDSRAHYSCDDGYKLVGLKYRTCGYDGIWIGELPKCIPSRCPSIGDPLYGTVSIPGYTPGSRAHYTCHDGYKLVGDAYRTCNDDCVWTGEPPRCVLIKCKHLENPQYGRVHTTDYTVGSNAEYTCTYGYRLVGESTRTCQYDEMWSGIAPVCEPITCPKLYNIQYGQVHVTDYRVDSRASYKCNYGYELVGESSRRCRDNGQWGGDEPVCQRKQLEAMWE